MRRNGFTEQVKTRLSIGMKQQLEAIAKERELDVSDIIRDALREFVAKRNAVVEKLLVGSQLEASK